MGINIIAVDRDNLLAEVLGQAQHGAVLAFGAAALGWSLVAPGGKPPSEAPATLSPRRRTALAAGFFMAGAYAGFVQAGVGFLLIALTTAARFDLVRGNAVKVLTVLCPTVLTLAIFAVLTPNILSAQNILNLLSQVSMVAIAGIGMTFAITMDDAYIVDITTAGGTDRTSPREVVSVIYRKITWTYTDGSISADDDWRTQQN